MKLIRGLFHKGTFILNKYRLFLFYRHLLNNKDLVFDIGANVGDKTKIFRNLNCRVIAVEPQQNCVKILMNRFRNDENVTVLKVGVGKIKGKKKLYVRSRYNGFSSFSPDWMNSTKYEHFDFVETVPIMTLEQLIRIYGLPQFCKIDVEGYESEVLKGLKSKIPCLSFEYGTLDSDHFKRLRQCLNLLDACGYSRYNFAGPESSPTLLNWVNSKELFTLVKREAKKGLPGGDVYAQ